MTDRNDVVNVLAHPAAARRISRRAFLAGATVTAAGSSILISGCGGDDEPSSGASAAPSGELEDQINMYTWGEYDWPKVMKDFTKEFGPDIEVSSYNSNEEMISKLVATEGTSGYDIVVPTGVFIPQMVENDLLQPLDLERIPNFENIGEEYRDQPWDPGNGHSVPKAWGTTGYVYDKNHVTRPMATWQDFIDAAQNEASGQTSILDDPNESIGIYFWSRDEDWNTEDPAALDQCEDFLVNELAPHIKAFESYPGSSGIPQGSYWLCQAWNGDARQGIITSKENNWEWVFPAPRSELWMDNWCIPTGAPNPNAAYAWINYNLDKDVSLQTLSWVGYHTAVAGIEPAAEEAGIERLDMVFFTPDQVATMDAGEVNNSQQRRVEIANNMKAAAVG
ncbi:MAG TPA: spermidine/putrescine ABC transporter substrate-binding protein [Actinomycetes bacterium]|nr:spermidine/putrescine ABC transporter substrate-binding protein [Actinomycetes bacterium]